ncbi:MAG: LysR family transcriptional regulator [Herminiimonas sp.]|nr:LysR family transcriptional regulator [Herminiimonas sp.]
MNLNDIDLNLLVVFNHLLAERRVAAVAKKLNVSQPAVSNALNRLRKLLDDKLFLRSPTGMEPTAFALQLAEPVAHALSTLHAALNERATFDPATSARRFTLGLNDIGEINFLPKLMDKLNALSPNVSISTLRNTTVNLQDAMEAGQVDLAMGTLPHFKTGYFQRRLFKQRYVCMFRSGHIFDKGSLSLDEYCSAEHLVVVPPGSGHAEVNESIERKGIHRNVRLTVPHYVAVGHILANNANNMVATVPESYAKQCAKPFGLTYVPHPLALPEIDINLFWHAKVHKEAGNKWLRDVVCGIFSDSEVADASL